MQQTTRYLALILAATLAACSSSASRSAAASSSSAADLQKIRVVALMPSVAEDLLAIGAAPQVVAVSSFTDEKAFKSLPRVADFSSVDAEKIVALKPDLVIGIPAQARLVEPLSRAGIKVELLADDTYEQIFSNLETIGEYTGRSAQAKDVVRRLLGETAALHAKTRTFKRHPSVFVVLGTGPIWTAGAGSYLGTLIELAGGTNAASSLRQPYGQFSAEALLRAQPDALVTDPAVGLHAALGNEPWRTLRAVQAGHLYVVNPASIVERPGPHYNEGLAWLVERLTPLAQ